MVYDVYYEEEIERLKKLIQLRDFQLDIIAERIEQGDVPPVSFARIRFDVPNEDDVKKAMDIWKDHEQGIRNKMLEKIRLVKS